MNRDYLYFQMSQMFLMSHYYHLFLYYRLSQMFQYFR